MSIIIYDVSLPKDGLVRNISIFEDGSVRYYGGSRVISSAVELPPHGRLIDADKIETERHGNNSQRIMWSNIRQLLSEAETIIPAEE